MRIGGMSSLSKDLYVTLAYHKEQWMLQRPYMEWETCCMLARQLAPSWLTSWTGPGAAALSRLLS